MVLHNMAAKKEGVDIQAASCSPGEYDDDVTYPEKGVKYYWKHHNIESIDGLPALSEAFNSTKVFNVYTPQKKLTIKSISSGCNNSSSPNFFDTRLVTGIAIGASATAAVCLVWLRLNSR